MSICLWLRMHNSLLPLNIYLLVSVQVTPQNRACRKHTSAVTSSWVHPYTQEKKSQILKQLKTYPPLTVAFTLLRADKKRKRKKEKKLERLSGVEKGFQLYQDSQNPPSSYLHIHKSPSHNSQKCGINSLCLHECLVFEIESISASLSGTWHNLAWGT